MPEAKRDEASSENNEKVEIQFKLENHARGDTQKIIIPDSIEDKINAGLKYARELVQQGIYSEIRIVIDFLTAGN